MNEPVSTQKSRIGQLFRKLDIHPLYLSFTHGRYQGYKSGLSGFLSFLALLSIFSYFLYLASDIWNFKVSINNTLMKRDLVFDNTTFDLQEQNFDFAVNVLYQGANKSISSNIHKFISMNINSFRSRYIETDEGVSFTVDMGTIPLEKCTDKAFNNDTKYLEQMRIVGNYYCPVTRNFTLQGGMSSTDFSVLSFNIRECKQEYLDEHYPGELCAPLEEQQDVASKIVVTALFTNYYFSGENRFEPIQQDYKMLSLGVPYQQTFITMVKLSVNYAILKDSWLFESFHTQNLSYSTIRVDSQYGRAQIPYHMNSPYMSITILLDENVHVNERIVFNFITALQSIGGFASVVMVVIRIVSSLAQEYNYFSEMIALLYTSENQDIGRPEMVEHEAQDDFSGHEHSARELAVSPPRKKSVKQKADLERDIPTYSQQVSRLISKYFQRRPPNKIGFCSYLLLKCNRGSGASNIFSQGKAMLNQELNLELVLRKLRMQELFIDLTLNPFQKTILKVLATKVPIATESCKEAETDKLFDGDQKAFEECAHELFQANEYASSSDFNRRLFDFLGLVDYKSSKKGRNTAKEKKRKSSVVQHKGKKPDNGPSLSFKKAKKEVLDGEKEEADRSFSVKRKRIQIQEERKDMSLFLPEQNET